MPPQSVMARPSLRLRPLQVPVQKFKCALTIDRMWPDKPFDFCPFRDFQSRSIESADFSVLVPYRFIRSHTVEMSSFDHKRPWRDQGRHLRIVERAAQVEFENLVFATPNITITGAGRGVLPHPLVEVGRTDR